MGEGFLTRRGKSVKGDAEASHVLAGKTFSSKVAGIGVTGTMPNRGAVVITPSTSNQTIQVGYHNGQGYVKGDVNLVPANIVQGKSIFGVLGTAYAGKKCAQGSFADGVMRGLTFRPSFVVVYTLGEAVYVSMYGGNPWLETHYFRRLSGTSASVFSLEWTIYDDGFAVNNTNFTHFVAVE